MTGQRWRFLLLVVSGLAGLAAVRLLIVGNWGFRCPDGTTSEACDGPVAGEGFAGQVGFWPLMVVVVASCAGMVAAFAAELYVRHRTQQRRSGGEGSLRRP